MTSVLYLTRNKCLLQGPARSITASTFLRLHSTSMASFSSRISSSSSSDSARDRATEVDVQLMNKIMTKYTKDEFFRLVHLSNQQDTMAYTMSFASAESDFTSSHVEDLLDDRMKRQLHASEGSLLHDKEKETKWKPSPLRMDDAKTTDSLPLPRSLEEALRPSPRAIVVTEATPPFKIVDVNKAWEGLCEYSYVECHGKTLGSLIQGPETDKSAITALISQMMRGEEAGTVITNYTKSGRKFRNRLRVGPLMDGDNIAYFVGILREVNGGPQAQYV